MSVLFRTMTSLKQISILPKIVNYGNFIMLRRPSSIRPKHLQRLLSTQTSQQHSETDKFMAVFPEIISFALQRAVKLANTYKVQPWLKELLEYNTVGGYKIRGLMTVNAYQMLEDPEKITEESLHNARIVGWCLEMLQAALIVQDDLLDNSFTRRGTVCWFRLPHVGMTAINDSTIIHCLILDALKHKFKKESFYPHLLSCFNEAMLSFCLGQHLDLKTAQNYDLFTLENYKNIAITKMAWSFKVSLYCGLILSNKTQEDAFENTDDIIKNIGVLIMMQNEFMDCFGDEDVAGKIGTDIQEGKCTWLAVSALQRFNAAQRAEFEACYGSVHEAHVQRVKQLYRDVQLPDLYRAAKQDTYTNIVQQLEALPANNVIPSSVILQLLDMIYNLRAKPKK